MQRGKSYWRSTGTILHLHSIDKLCHFSELGRQANRPQACHHVLLVIFSSQPMSTGDDVCQHLHSSSQRRILFVTATDHRRCRRVNTEQFTTVR